MGSVNIGWAVLTLEGQCEHWMGSVNIGGGSVNIGGGSVNIGGQCEHSHTSE